MKTEKPILFNTKMVKAIFNGTKTQTRRILPEKIKNKIFSSDRYIFGGKIMEHCMCQGMPDGSGGLETDHWEEDVTSQYSKYKIGDILYVKETFVKCTCGECEICNSSNGLIYKADFLEDGNHPDFYTCHLDEIKLTPSLFMSKKDARLFLKVNGVRIERLQDITFNDIRREGIYPLGDITEDSNNYISHIQELWINLWNSTTTDGYKWEDNPYVFVYEFEKVDKP